VIDHGPGADRGLDFLELRADIQIPFEVRGPLTHGKVNDTSAGEMQEALVQPLLALLAFDMATLTIRQSDDKTKGKLRVRAAQHGRSMEEEAREILRSALRTSPAARENLGKAIRERFAPLRGVELELPRQDPIRQTAPFAE
jgi:antitoxin FitA